MTIDQLKTALMQEGIKYSTSKQSHAYYANLLEYHRPGYVYIPSPKTTHQSSPQPSPQPSLASSPASSPLPSITDGKKRTHEEDLDSAKKRKVEIPVARSPSSTLNLPVLLTPSDEGEGESQFNSGNSTPVTPVQPSVNNNQIQTPLKPTIVETQTHIETKQEIKPGGPLTTQDGKETEDIYISLRDAIYWGNVKDVEKLCEKIDINQPHDKLGCIWLRDSEVYVYYGYGKHLNNSGTPVKSRLSLGNLYSALSNWVPYAAAYATDTSDESPSKNLQHVSSELRKPVYLPWTPLHFACARNEPEIIKKLVEMGADISWEDATGRTARNVVDMLHKGDYGNLLKPKKQSTTPIKK